MSSYIDEILKCIKNNPEEWTPSYGYSYFNGMKREGVSVRGWGNTRMLSCISVYVKGRDVKVSYFEKWKLEVALNKYYTSLSVKSLLRGEKI